MKATDFSFDDLTLGQTVSFERTISKKDIQAFAQLSGDENPLHGDEDYARTTQFGRPIAHGMLLGALCSTLIGMHLPGKRALLVREELSFKEPVYAEDSIEVEGKVVAKSEATKIVEIAIRLLREQKTIVEGVAHVRIL